MFELLRYQRSDLQEPLTEWLNTLSNKAAQARIRVRLRNLQAGNWGDCSPVGSGVVELRIHIGPGYRVYCARYGKSVVILLCGGDKSSQGSDIKMAQGFWAEWKRRRR